MKIAINSENLEKEFTTFWNGMQFCGLSNYYNNEDIEVLQKQLFSATCALNEDTGCSYPGSLLVHINLATALAQRIAKMISGTFSIDDESLVKVCLLMHLSKIEMYIPNDNQWEIEKRGLNYKFAELSGKLKFGERSILNAMNKGIKLTAEEFEAIKCLDNEKEGNSKYGDCIMSTIVRQANELAYAIEKEKYNKL